MMRDLDDADRAIPGPLLEDGRRSWGDVAGAVALSPPAVADPVVRVPGVLRR